MVKLSMFLNLPCAILILKLGLFLFFLVILSLDVFMKLFLQKRMQFQLGSTYKHTSGSCKFVQDLCKTDGSLQHLQVLTKTNHVTPCNTILMYVYNLIWRLFVSQLLGESCYTQIFMAHASKMGILDLSLLFHYQLSQNCPSKYIVTC